MITVLFIILLMMFIGSDFFRFVFMEGVAVFILGLASLFAGGGLIYLALVMRFV